VGYVQGMSYVTAVLLLYMTRRAERVISHRISETPLLRTRVTED